MWLLSKEGALEKRRTSKLYAMEKEITVSEEWYKGLMDALDAQEASVLRVLWDTMLLLMAFFAFVSLSLTFRWCMLILVAWGQGSEKYISATKTIQIYKHK